MAIEHLDMLIDEARSGTKELRSGESHRLAARLGSCADALEKLRDERTARDAEMRDERARVEAAESKVARLTAREQTLMRVCEELRRSHPGMTHAHVERLEALTARLATAERLLRTLEWSGLPAGGLRNCLFCSAKVLDSGEVHRAGCELAAFLAGPARDSA